MSKARIVTVTWRPGEPLPPSDTDWTALAAMTDEDVGARALADPDAPPLTDEQLARMRPIAPVRRLREQLGLSRKPGV